MIHHATNTTFNTLLTTSNKPILVDFYADWCGPCMAMMPVLENLSADGYDIIKVNIDENEELANEYGVRSIPYFIVFEDGQPTQEAIGMQTIDALKDMLK